MRTALAILSLFAVAGLTSCARPAASAAPAPPAPTLTATSAPAPCNCRATTLVRNTPPYTAKRVSTTVQKLSDGTIITRVTESLIAHDGEGRTRNETTRTPPDGTAMRYINVTDPVEGVTLSWAVDGPPSVPKVVTLRHYLRQNPQPPISNPQPARRYYPYTTQSLPPRPSTASTPKVSATPAPPPPATMATTTILS